MNVLFIGPYRQQDYWGKISRSFINLLSKEDIKLVTRPLYYNIANKAEDIGNIEQYEFNSIDSKDIIIQFGLPMSLNYSGEFKKNIAATMTSSMIKNIGWTYQLNLFEDVLVFSEQEKEILKSSGVKSNIKNLITPPIEFDNTMQKIPIDLRNKFVFYSDADINTTSGLKQTLVSYLSEFNISNNVCLVLFCDQQNSEEYTKYTELVKKELDIFHDYRNYAEVIIIGTKDQGAINYAHDNFDCYINVGFNMNMNMQIFQAFNFMRPCLLLDSCRGFLKSEYPCSVDSIEETCVSPEQRPVPHLNSGENFWKIPSTKSMKQLMRKISESKNIIDTSKQMICDFNHNHKSELEKGIKEILCLQ